MAVASVWLATEESPIAVEVTPEARESVPIAVELKAVALALCPIDGNDIETLIKVADRSMYRRKPVKKTVVKIR